MNARWTARSGVSEIEFSGLDIESNRLCVEPGIDSRFALFLLRATNEKSPVRSPLYFCPLEFLFSSHLFQKRYEVFLGCATRSFG